MSETTNLFMEPEVISENVRCKYYCVQLDLVFRSMERNPGAFFCKNQNCVL